MREAYAKNKRVMSFEEYFALFTAQPERQGRSAAQYVRDVFDHFGTEEVRHPRGTVTRWKLFDCPWDRGRDRLIGQEEAQARVYRVLSNFTREGRVNKLILLHGPNGSAKSTMVSCIARALEYYSALDEGALYRFNWIFPSHEVATGGIGFGGGGAERYDVASKDTYAYLTDEQVAARIGDELRDHPLFLIPAKRRRELLRERLTAANRSTPAPPAPGGEFVPSDYI